MGAIAVQTHSVLQFPKFSCFTFTNQPKFRNLIFSPTDVPFRLTVSCLGSDGNTRDRATQRSSKTRNDKEDENSHADKKPNSSSQEDILAIFRRIQSSMSKEEPIKYDTANPKVIEGKSPAASILKVLGESGKKQGRAKNEEVNDKILTRKRSVTKKDQAMRDYPQVTDSKFNRPASNFVKRSPIPFPTSPRGISLELKNEMSLTASGPEERDQPRLEKMKLAELKELAKFRGFKGYSKLKKSELINLLKS